ncbi:MAG: bifunctional 2-keto-4-hydroxyglutarate aldolase/2-keto-3-deoxy-6-phosphogluconate aldolase [Acholeplasmatales bacterium]|jgi:2-dehydro-3-deoxyphosphogluconate aldolase/(4S)-4-hydroxy-2-oxoglutarate aldolase|nr:bifunctional 2-keto-4-hydroxyglutarate aldolase/2-keto-3-deoxy-6-phosphogluconate aldolase [Acholeplasmatales bacterium]
MQKYDILNKVISSKIVAVVRASSSEEAKELIDGLVLGGIKAVEITFTVNGAPELITKLSSLYKDIIFGAGTVLDAVTARIAILAGAKFIVSPSLDEETAKLCGRYQIPYLPGCVTINEIIHALECGADIIKLFPGSLVSSDYVKAIKGPLPYVNIMPTGGVNLDNINDWFKKGVVAVGVGSELTKFDISSSIKKEVQIAETVKKFLNKIA